MRQLAQSQVSNGDEVGRGSKSACSSFGLLHHPVHGLDEGVAAVIEHAAHDRIEVGLECRRQPLEGLQPTARNLSMTLRHPGTLI